MAKTKEAPPVRKMTVTEREGLSEQIREEEGMLRATEEFRDADAGAAPVIPAETNINKDKIRAHVNHLKQQLAEGTPEEVRARDRDALKRRAEELKAKFIPYLETHQDLGATRPDSPEYKAALKKALDRPRVEGYIHEYREIMKRLEPDNPDAGSLDELRLDR